MKKLITSKLLSVLVLALFSVLAINAQTVTGVMTDADSGEPLIGANVLVKGTTVGTITDIDGSYSLSLPDGATTLVFSYAGFQDQEVDIAGQSTINVALSPGALLDEVVVIGYGTVKKRDVTGSVASLKEEDFNKGIIVSTDQLLQGRVPGVNVVQNSGRPGGEATVKIRGNNSIRAGADPLYVVDGFPLDGRSARAGLLSNDLGSIPNSNPLNFLNPSDIASIEILKDASSAAIYGARGANGVILVTTKKGRSTEPTIDFNASFGASSIVKKYDVLSADQYRAALNDYGITSGGDGNASVDAFDEILRTGMTQSFSFSIGGGSENGNYRLSLGYLDQEGIIEDSGIKRYNMTYNANYEFLDGKVGMDVFSVASHSEEAIAPISTNAGFTGNLVGQALQWNPTIPLTSNGDFTTNSNNSTSATVGATTINPLQLLAAHDEDANTTTILGSISPYINLTDNLQYRYRFGLNYGVGNTRGNIRGFVNVQGIEDRGFAAVSQATLFSQLHSHTLSYNTELTPEISMNALAGYEYQEFDFKGYAAGGFGYTVLDFDNTNALQNTSEDTRGMFSFADPISEIQSYFGRVNFNMSDKYLFTATVRADGSSKFGENNRYGIFPSAAFAWNLHNEDFLADGGFNELKLRLGWGQTGNQEFPAGAAQERYQLVTGGAQQENVANPDLRWETSTTLNVGLDFALFDFAVSGTVEYFQRTSTDILLDPFVSEPGPAVRAWQNIDGEVFNSGVEIGLNAYLVDQSDLQFSIGANAAFLSNEFRNPTGADIIVGEVFGQGSSGATIQVMRDGLPLNTFYTREFIEIGDDGNSVYTDGGNTLVELGDPNANLILGLTTNLRAGDFSFVTNWNGAFGHQLYNNTKMSVIPIGNLGNRNVDANLIGTPQESVANPITASSRYIEDGDFIKLSNATVAYRIGDIEHFKNINVSLTGQNLFVITDYTGFDPEVNTVNLRNGIPSNGIEYIPYPAARSIILGVSASF
ncbi:MAG: SusC/RagA family TonB-linked outer membrane protein [Saprospiraceae bacterium]|jgi:TonB-linked SusC/RagA family outer membrane protein